MKKHHFLFFIFFSFLLTSCFYHEVNRRTNPIFEGEHSGVSAYDETQSCVLKITKISEDIYKRAKGTDVVQDFV